MMKTRFELISAYDKDSFQQALNSFIEKHDTILVQFASNVAIHNGMRTVFYSALVEYAIK